MKIDNLEKIMSFGDDIIATKDKYVVTYGPEDRNMHRDFPFEHKNGRK